MQNNGLIGRLVISKAGRDKDQSYILIDVIDDQNVLLANGKTKTIEMPKKKKSKHIELTNVLDESIKNSILSQNKNINLIIKRFLNLNGTVKEV